MRRLTIDIVWNPGEHPRGQPQNKGEFAGKGTGGQTNHALRPGHWQLPSEPGTTPIPEGHIRLYHQTSPTNLNSIRRHGILRQHAQGIEGPKAIYADPSGFYGKPGDKPTVEFHVPKERWSPPFVLGESVEPNDIIAVHHPWHATARYIEQEPKVLKETLAGKHDNLLKDPFYGPAIRFIKHKYARGA